MSNFFKPTSYKLADGTWVSQYTKITQSGEHTSTQNNSLDKKFNTKKEADKYVTNFCLQKGYKLVN